MRPQPSFDDRDYINNGEIVKLTPHPTPPTIYPSKTIHVTMNTIAAGLTRPTFNPKFPWNASTLNYKTTMDAIQNQVSLWPLDFVVIVVVVVIVVDIPVVVAILNTFHLAIDHSMILWKSCRSIYVLYCIQFNVYIYL